MFALYLSYVVPFLRQSLLYLSLQVISHWFTSPIPMFFFFHTRKNNHFHAFLLSYFVFGCLVLVSSSGSSFPMLVSLLSFLLFSPSGLMNRMGVGR